MVSHQRHGSPLSPQSQKYTHALHSLSGLAETGHEERGTPRTGGQMKVGQGLAQLPRDFGQVPASLGLCFCTCEMGITLPLEVRGGLWGLRKQGGRVGREGTLKPDRPAPWARHFALWASPENGKIRASPRRGARKTKLGVVHSGHLPDASHSRCLC